MRWIENLVFSQARDAETFHAKLYERAIYHVIKDEIKAYHVCQVCGYVTEKKFQKNAQSVGLQKRNLKL